MDKFKKFRLTPVESAIVKPPIIDECYAAIECRVADDTMADRYCLFVLEAVKAWIDPSVKEPATIHHRGRGIFSVAGKTIRIPSKMK